MTEISVELYASLDEARALKRAEINAACERSLAPLRTPYPSSEIASWAQQEREARDWQADPSAATPLLDAIAAARGRTREDIVERVLAKSATFKTQAGRAFGKRQALQDRIEACTTVREVLAIRW